MYSNNCGWSSSSIVNEKKKIKYNNNNNNNKTMNTNIYFIFGTGELNSNQRVVQYDVQNV